MPVLNKHIRIKRIILLNNPKLLNKNLFYYLIINVLLLVINCKFFFFESGKGQAIMTYKTEYSHINTSLIH
jgi:hypothetical protein